VESPCILPELRPVTVTSVQVIPSGALEIRSRPHERHVAADQTLLPIPRSSRH